MPFSLFLCLRYLVPKRVASLIVGILSIIGVALGITLMILVLSVMTGFGQELRRKILGFDAHIVITNGALLPEWEKTAADMASAPGVVAVAPFVQGPVLVQFQGRVLAPQIRGVDLEREEKITQIASYITQGAADLDGDKAIIGSALAKAFGLSVGDTITVYSPGNLQDVLAQINQMQEQPAADPAASTPEAHKKALDGLKEMILPAELTITGIFESGRYQYDSEFLLVPLHIGQELYGLQSDVHGLTIRTADPYQADPVAANLRTRLPDDFRVLTWMDMNSKILEAVNLERTVMFFLLFFIVIVASFGITITLLTITIQKTREIGIVKAIGATTWQIAGVFLGQGMIIGFFGILLGIGGGILLVTYRNPLAHAIAAVRGIEIFPKEIYQFTEIPAQILPSEVAVICVSAFLISSLAALIPALVAAHMDPIKALRQE